MDQNIDELKELPFPSPEAGRSTLVALITKRNILALLEAVHKEMGNIFRIPLPGFKPVFLVGPEANKFVTVTNRNDLRWRSEGDPVTEVLREGLLVTDGAMHDNIRHTVNPALHKKLLEVYFERMLLRTNQVLGDWKNNQILDMLIEMRKIALLIIIDTLYHQDFTHELNTLWVDIKKLLAHISPGIWVIFPDVPRPGHRRSLKKLDDYMYKIIKERRNNPLPVNDLLGVLVNAEDFDDNLIRDQLMTIFIAGHDTSTATLAWALYLLASHPEILKKAQDEIDEVIGVEVPTFEAMSRLEYLDKIIREALRLYPPIHIGNRRAAKDLVFQNYRIPSGTRVVYSIYLTHRMEKYWPEPTRFNPERFNSENINKRPPYSYIPFGGGPRNCIGMAFAIIEAKLVLSCVLQKFDFDFPPGEFKKIHPHMGATLEPSPGVKLKISYRPFVTQK